MSWKEMQHENNIRRWRQVVAPIADSLPPEIEDECVEERNYLAGMMDALDWVVGERIDNPALSFVNRFEEH